MDAETLVYVCKESFISFLSQGSPGVPGLKGESGESGPQVRETKKAQSRVYKKNYIPET